MHHMIKYTSLFSNTSVFTVHTTMRKRSFVIDPLGSVLKKTQMSQDKNAVSVWTVFSVSCIQICVDMA